MLTGLSFSLFPSSLVQCSQSKTFFSYKEMVTANNSQCHGAENTWSPSGWEIGLDIDFHKKNWLVTTPEFSNKGPRFRLGFSGNILVLTIHPGFQTNQLESIALENIHALIIRAYGSGNFPVKGEYSWIPFLHRCKNMDLITVITSQANHDAVNLKNYLAGRTALDFGVLSSGDMTLEASITKMMWLISAHQDNDESNLEIVHRFQENLRGERS